METEVDTSAVTQIFNTQVSTLAADAANALLPATAHAWTPSILIVGILFVMILSSCSKYLHEL